MYRCILEQSAAQTVMPALALSQSGWADYAHPDFKT